MTEEKTTLTITAIASMLSKMLLAFLIALAPLLAPDIAYSQNNFRDIIDPNRPIVIDPDLRPVRPQLLCVAPKKLNAAGNRCVCPAGMRAQGNGCVANIQILCSPPMRLNAAGNKCVCPAGLRKVGNRCLPNIIQVICQPPFVRNAAGNKCVCPAGLTKVGNTCRQARVPLLCVAPFVLNARGTRCVCPAGLEKRGNRCIRPQAAPSCNFPFVYSARRDSCVCADGYRLNNSGNRCIRKQTSTQPTVARATVREIQSCLGKLGYDAGPADGAIGNRTRTAWGNFRIDQGLQGRPSSLADAVTQDRLFQACAKPSQSSTQPLPDVEPEENAETTVPAIPTSTNFDPEEGYPAIQCVSAGLQETFKPLLPEGEEVGICGQACVPIPDGMTPAQIATTGETVNWCRNCAKVGENGLICTMPAKPEEETSGDDTAN